VDIQRPALVVVAAADTFVELQDLGLGRMGLLGQASAEMLLDPAFDYITLTAVGPALAELNYSVRSADCFAVVVRTGWQFATVENFAWNYFYRLPSSANVAPTLG